MRLPRAARRDALHGGFTIEEIFNRTKIDCWFVMRIKEFVDFEEELARARNWKELWREPEVKLNLLNGFPCCSTRCVLLAVLLNLVT